jgi:hypothetical protein
MNKKNKHTDADEDEKSRFDDVSMVRRLRDPRSNFDCSPLSPRHGSGPETSGRPYYSFSKRIGCWIR